MALLTSSLVGLALVIGGTVFFVLGLRSASYSEISSRLKNYVREESGELRPTKSQPHRREPTGSFTGRIMVPWIRGIARLFGRLTPSRMYEEMSHTLTLAGNPLGLGPREFYGLQLLSSVLGLWLAFVLLRGALETPDAGIVRPGLGSAGAPVTSSTTGAAVDFPSLVGSALSLYIFNYLPKTWLKNRVRSRQEMIRKGLPDALDMLSVCADAGLGFDQGLQRVSEHWDTPLGNEFARVVAEMGMGVPRREALRNLADRADVPELSSFVAVIMQSDQLGMSITETLHAQAKQMRVERRFRAQEQARKMPLKMLFPLLLLIFPAMFAVILGPLVPVLGELFTTLRISTQ